MAASPVHPWDATCTSSRYVRITTYHKIYALTILQADTSGFTSDPKSILDNIPKNFKPDNDIINALQGAAAAKQLKSFYKVGLFSYCEGDKDNKTGVETITFCSGAKSNFWFDPFAVWGLKDTNLQKAFGDKLQGGLNTYKRVTGWMIWSFGIALVLSAAEFIIGFFAIFSRWGSLVTAIVSTVSLRWHLRLTLSLTYFQAQTIFIIAAAATATSVYAVLVGVFESVLKPYNIKASMGKQMLSVMWLAVAFGLGSGLFWLLSTCCCSGKSAHKKVSVEKTPYTYERVASPAFPPQHGQQTGYIAGAAHNNGQTAYEPFRASRV